VSSAADLNMRGETGWLRVVLDSFQIEITYTPVVSISYARSLLYTPNPCKWYKWIDFSGR
jgi:hypothetical protein